MAVIINGSEVVLSGMVGGSANGEGFWTPDGFSASDVITALATVGAENPVTIHLNSGGGFATEGAAIYAAIAQHKGAVHIIGEGIVASAATVVAAAADTFTMMPGAVFMVHDVATITIGNEADHDASIRGLRAMSDAYAGIYAERTGKPAADMRDLMRAETWLTPEQAVEAGFADGVGAANDNEVEPSAFAYASVYRHAPERLVALANARGWKAPAAMTALTVPKKEDPMTEPTNTPPASPPAPAAVDVVAVAAICAEAGMTADQINAFMANGGTLERARARVAEVKEMRADLESAKRLNPACTASMDDFLARNLSVEHARSELFKHVAPPAGSAAASPELHTATPTGTTATTPKKSLMESAAERVSARAKAARSGRF